MWTFLLPFPVVIFVLRRMFFINIFWQRKISEMSWPIGAKFCTVINSRLNFTMPVQNFGGHTPKKFQGPKTCKIWPDFGWLQTLAANISKKDEDIENRTSTFCTTIPSGLGERSLVNFDPLVMEIKWWNHTHSNRIFRKIIFWPLRGAISQNFYTC